MLTGSVSAGWFPYRYKADLAGDLLIKEEAAIRLDTGDTLLVQWRYLWASTPACLVCTNNEVLWGNGWSVWTDAAPERGIVIFRSSHSELPLAAEVWFFPDPIQWPEALAESNPMLWTSLEEAEEVTAAILESILRAVPAPPP